jgi:hypothetical protein
MQNNIIQKYIDLIFRKVNFIKNEKWIFWDDTLGKSFR